MEKEILALSEAIINEFVTSIRTQAKKANATIDYAYSYHKSVFRIYKIFPLLENTKEDNYYPFIQIKFNNDEAQWYLYGLDDTGEWEAYQPFPKSDSIAGLITIIENDKAYFFRNR